MNGEKKERKENTYPRKMNAFTIYHLHHVEKHTKQVYFVQFPDNIFMIYLNFLGNIHNFTRYILTQ